MTRHSPATVTGALLILIGVPTMLMSNLFALTLAGLLVAWLGVWLYARGGDHAAPSPTGRGGRQ